MYSDHNPVELILSGIEQNNKGRGFWKLNTSLLKDKDYVNKINATLDEEIENHKNMQNRSLAWDTIKMQIRSASISYATYKAKKTREYEKQLKMELDKLEKKMSTMPNEDIKLEYYTNQKELEQINNQQARGQQIRARALHIEYNEKNSEYFYKKEISNAKAKNMATIQFSVSVI
jgi:hypothetical protein